MAQFFGTNGVRGKFDFLTPELAMNIAKAIGIYFNRGKIIVARDGRLTGECLKYAVNAGLQSVGCTVVDMDHAPAPTAEFMIKKLKANGLIIITASHNPPEWNAMKVVDSNGISISSERGEEIEKLIDCVGCADWRKIGKVEGYKNGIRENTEAIKKHININKIQRIKPKIVLDCGNGMAALIAPTLFREIGCRVLLINEIIDGHFPGRPSEPTKENVKELMQRVVKEKADAGFAWDGDGDRLIAIDEKGEYVIGDRIVALSVLLKLKQKKGDVVTTVATSKAVEDVAKSFGCRVLYTRIGAPYLSEAMAANIGEPYISAGAVCGERVIGGEEVGGVVWPEISLAKDGFMTAAKITEAICEKPLSGWIAALPEYYNAKTKINATSKQKKKVIDRIKKHAKDNKLKSIDIDGVRIDFEDSWVIIRASGTEDYIRIFTEAKSGETTEELLATYEKIVKKVLH